MKIYFQSDDSQSYEYLYYRKEDFLTFPAGDDIQIYILIWNNSLGHVMAVGSNGALFHIISETRGKTIRYFFRLCTISGRYKFIYILRSAFPYTVILVKVLEIFYWFS
jgi:hypothetical protein